MSPEQEAVNAFHQKFGIKVPTVPTMPADERIAYRISHLDEEVQEFAEAALSRDFAGMIHEIVDVLYVAYGAASEMGIDLAPFFAEVHAANMRKTGGKRRADGKILKPAGWTPADIQAVLLRQMPDSTKARVLLRQHDTAA